MQLFWERKVKGGKQMESFVKEIEYTLLGEMLVSQDVLNQAIQVLNYDDFTTLEIKRLYEIIIDLYKQGEKEKNRPFNNSK